MSVSNPPENWVDLEFLNAETLEPLNAPPQFSPSPPAPPSTPETALAPNRDRPNRDQQVWFQSEGGKLLLQLPLEGEAEQINPATAFSWNDIYQQIQQRLNSGDRFWQPDTPVELVARDRLLDGRQLQAIADLLTTAQLHLHRVLTSRRQTAVAAATAGYSVEQQAIGLPSMGQAPEAGKSLENPLYLETTVRSGGDIRHNGNVIILGDLNPGSSVVAAGDILIWGRLRGTVHAGSKGNARAVIMALQMEPTQIRIADFLARPPETPPALFQPEVAYVTPQGAIRIARAVDFYKSAAAALRGK
jgi:septum site-determining protein MinC